MLRKKRKWSDKKYSIKTTKGRKKEKDKIEQRIGQQSQSNRYGKY